MNYFLVVIAVKYKTFTHKTKWVVCAEPEQQARRSALHNESHSHNLSQIDELCAGNNYTQLQDGVFHYEIIEVIEQQIVEANRYNNVAVKVLVAKDVSLLSTWDDVVPLDGDWHHHIVTADWCVDGKKKTLEGFTGSREGKLDALAYFLKINCNSLTDEQAKEMIRNRLFHKDVEGSGTYALNKAVIPERLDITINGVDYLIAIPTDAGADYAPVLSICGAY